MSSENEEIINSFRCLRKQLNPFLTPEYRKVLEQMEKLAEGEKTIPAMLPPKKKETHRDRVMKYFNK